MQWTSTNEITLSAYLFLLDICSLPHKSDLSACIFFVMQAPAVREDHFTYEPFRVVCNEQCAVAAMVPHCGQSTRSHRGKWGEFTCSKPISLAKNLRLYRMNYGVYLFALYCCALFYIFMVCTYSGICKYQMQPTWDYCLSIQRKSIYPAYLIRMCS